MAGATALALSAQALPLFQIERTPWSALAPEHYVGVLLTSANAVREAGSDLKRYIGLPAYAVGEATAEWARAAGFASVVAGDRDVAALVARVATLGHHRVLHLAGEETAPIQPVGIELEKHIVYRAAPIDPPPQFYDLLEQNPVALVHSRRAGDRFASLVKPAHRQQIALVAISENAAAGAGEGWQKLAIAGEPRDEAMLRIAARLCREGDSNR